MVRCRRGDQLGIALRQRDAIILSAIIPDKNHRSFNYCYLTPDRLLQAMYGEQSGGKRRCIERSDLAIGLGRRGQGDGRFHRPTARAMMAIDTPNSAKHIGTAKICPATAFRLIGPVHV